MLIDTIFLGQFFSFFQLCRDDDDFLQVQSKYQALE